MENGSIEFYIAEEGVVHSVGCAVIAGTSVCHMQIEAAK
jgi:hypothetical protein